MIKPKYHSITYKAIDDDGNQYTVDDLCGLLNEQQSTIQQLQDLCGESDSENAKLRIENEQLKNKLNEEYIKERSIK